MNERSTTDESDVHSQSVNADMPEVLTNHVHPLTSVAPDNTGDDLDPIGDIVTTVNVFGMGEASHGTREFFRVKHRIFRFLVEEHGFRLLGFEGNFAAGLAINEYVLTGKGSAEEVLSQESIHAVYQTDSVLELIEWIRTFNEGRMDSDKIRVHGFDMQDPVVATAKLKQYFETVDPEIIKDVASEIEQLTETSLMTIMDDEEQLTAHLEARSAVIDQLGDALDINERDYREQTSQREYEQIKRLVWQLEQGRKQFEAILEGPEGGETLKIRDKAMAEQIQWLLEHESADQIAIWGHNAHLGRKGVVHPEIGPDVREQIPSMGAHLAGSDTIEYFALQLSLGGGTVRSKYTPENDFRSYEIDDPPSGSLPAVFNEASTPLFFLNISQVPPESAFGEWFNSNITDYIITGGYEETPVKQVQTNPREEFDGILFIRDTTAADTLAEEV